ncbi:MAG: M20 family metallopeptidase [Anaerolineales bacterium]
MITLPEFAGQTGAVVALLKRLVEIESPSTNKAAVDRLGVVVADELRKLGALVTVDEQTVTGNHVMGHWGLGREGILILCHMDTVYDLGTLARQPCVEVDGKLRGPGTIDMKASLAITLSALAMLKAKRQWPPRPVTALFTSDEEIGSATSRPLIERLARQAALVLCMEPCLPDGSLKTWRKGVGDFEIIARGKATHAGADHENGRNAIEELAHHVLAAQKLTDYQKGTTLNVGVIHGGSRSNVVPDEARAHIDMRVMTAEDGERVTQWMKSLKPVLAGASVEVRGGLNRPPMPRDELMIATFKKAQTIAANLGLKIGEGGTGGGSDANFVAPLGVPVLDGLGALGNGAHSEREHVVIASLPERTALLAAILSEW